MLLNFGEGFAILELARGLPATSDKERGMKPLPILPAVPALLFFEDALGQTPVYPNSPGYRQRARTFTGSPYGSPATATEAVLGITRRSRFDWPFPDCHLPTCEFLATRSRLHAQKTVWTPTR